jgi:NTE family protein
MTNLNNIYDTICISGGGINGISFIGALEYLIKNKYLDISLIKKLYGVSVGAIISLLICMDYDIDFIYNFIIMFNFKSFNININIDINKLFSNYGLVDIDKIEYMIKYFIKNKYNKNDLTFEELYNITNKELYIIGTNCTKNIEEIFSYNTTPNMSILIAIKISIAVPLYFQPILYNNCYYLDGALINNFPINHCNEEKTLGLYLIKKDNIDKFDNIFNYIINIFNILSNSRINSIIKNMNNKNFIKIYKKMTNFVNFDITDKIKQELLDDGKNSAIEFINNL